jgi:hypothetical protein
MKKLARMTLLGAAITAAGCSDSTGEGGGGGGTPTPLLLSATAPDLCADSTGAWFKKDPINGQDSTIALVFPELGSDCLGSTEDFIRLTLKKTSLWRYPDGNLIANGDSVFISLKWVGSDSILFELNPSGLQFDPDNRAELKIEYDEAGDDLDGDGDTDAEDAEIEHRLDIWRQAQPDSPFVRVGTGKIEDSNEIEAKLTGFSRFMIAY